MKAKLQINGIEKSYPEEIDNLEKLLLFILDKEQSEGNTIVEVKTDGKTYSEEYDHQAREVDLDAIQQVDITTQTKEEFAQAFLNEVPNYLTQLHNGFDAAARLLRDPDEDKNDYDMLARSLEVLLDFRAHMQNVGTVLDKDVMGDDLSGLWDRFDNLADRIISLQEVEDSNAIAEALEDEVLPLLGEWKEKFV